MGHYFLLAWSAGSTHIEKIISFATSFLLETQGMQS